MRENTTQNGSGKESINSRQARQNSRHRKRCCVGNSCIHVGLIGVGIDIQKVQGLRGYDEVTHIANAPESIKGAVNLRGIIVPIIDMRTKFHHGTPSYDRFTVVIVLNISGHVVGTLVDSVSDVITLTPDQVKLGPEMGVARNTDYLVGLGTVEQRMLIQVDIDKRVSGCEIGLIEKLAA